MIIDMWIKEYEKPERINFAITLKEDNTLIGGIDVVGYLDGVNGIPVIGYVLSPKYWNKGYATEACLKVLEYLFSLGYKEVRIDADIDNIASNKVINKCGGIFIGTEIIDLPLKQTTTTVNKYIVKKKE